MDNKRRKEVIAICDKYIKLIDELHELNDTLSRVAIHERKDPDRHQDFGEAGGYIIEALDVVDDFRSQLQWEINPKSIKNGKVNKK